MRSRLRIAVLPLGWLFMVWLLGSGLWAQGTSPASAATPAGTPASAATPTDPAYAKLQAKLERETGVRRAQTLAQLADLDYAAARADYEAGNDAAGEQLLQRARGHAAAAYAIVQAEASQGKTKGIEKVEMPLRAISYGLRGLAMDVASVNRPPIQKAQAYFADMRSHVLDLMFSPNAK